MVGDSSRAEEPQPSHRSPGLGAGWGVCEGQGYVSLDAGKQPAEVLYLELAHMSVYTSLSNAFHTSCPGAKVK